VQGGYQEGMAGVDGAGGGGGRIFWGAFTTHNKVSEVIAFFLLEAVWISSELRNG
jgi:hypothetical protein